MALPTIYRSNAAFIATEGDRRQDAEGNSVDVALVLRLDGELRRTCGLEPDVFSASVPATELAKLGNFVGRKGYIRLFDGVGKGADLLDRVEIKGLRIVEVVVEELGEDDLGLAIPISYKVFFADDRLDALSAWTGGGAMQLGTLNKSPLTPPLAPAADGTWNDALGKPVKTHAQLIEICLVKMGIKNGLLDVPEPPKERRVAPALDLDWSTATGREECDRLMQDIGMTLAPRCDGSFEPVYIGINRIGNTDLLDPLVGQDAGGVEMDLPRIDKRPRQVAFTSAPYPIVRTRTYQGPVDIDGQSIASFDKLTWVLPYSAASDPAHCDRWSPADSVPWLKNAPGYMSPGCALEELKANGKHIGAEWVPVLREW